MTERNAENVASVISELLADREKFLNDFKTLEVDERIILQSSLEQAQRLARGINRELLSQKFQGDPKLICRPGPEGKLALLRENGCFTLDSQSDAIRVLSSAAQRLYGEYYFPNIQKHGQRALANLALDEFRFYCLMKGVWIPDGEEFEEVKVETIDDLRGILDKNVSGKICRNNPREPGYHGWFVAEVLDRYVAEWDAIRSQSPSA